MGGQARLRTGEVARTGVRLLVGFALVAGLVVGPLLGRGNLLEGSYSVDGLLVAFAGTVAFLSLVNMFRGRDGSLND